MTSLEQARLQVASDFITLAERDAVAMRVLAEVPEVAFAILGFHAQQCVEKSLKAVMAIHGVTFPRTHSLEELHRLLITANYPVPLALEVLTNLTPYAVSTRYDLDSLELLDLAEAQTAVNIALEWAQSQFRAAKKAASEC
jgi:HEPN domain-containing protein